MESILAEFAEATQNPFPRLIEWKQRTGKRIIGCLPMYVPEEIIHAGGMLPITLLGNEEALVHVDRYVEPYVCGIVRSNLDLALRGELNFLDGVIFPDICEAMQVVADIWRLHCPSLLHYNLMLPFNMRSARGVEYLKGQFERFRMQLESLVGCTISDQAMKESITIYNHNRSLLRHLFDLRRDNPSLLHARDVSNIIIASMLMPKEEHSALLSRLLERLEEVPKPEPEDSSVRLVLWGYLCEPLEEGILDLVEEVGAVVADDDLYVGSRYFAVPVGNTETPMDALTQRYFKDVPCPTKVNRDRDCGDYLVDMVKRSRSRAVVILTAKFCVPTAVEYPLTKKKLDKANIPSLVIETQHGVNAKGQLRTRLQALLETL